MAKTEKPKSCGIPRMVGIAVLLMIIGFVLRMVESILTMDYYMDPAYFSVWSKLMMPTAGPPPMEFFLASLASGFVIAFIYTWFFHYIRPVLADGNWMRTGACFGLLLFLVTTLTGTLGMALIVNLPLSLMAIWAFTGLLIDLIYGLVLAKLC